MFPPVAAIESDFAPSMRQRLRAAAEVVVALATLESYTLDDLLPTRFREAEPADDAASARAAPSTGTPGADHPYRQPLRSTRERRPGAPAQREQFCLTPLRKPTQQPPAAPRAQRPRRVSPGPAR